MAAAAMPASSANDRIKPRLPRESDPRFQTMVDNMERAEGHTLEVVKDMLVARGRRSPGPALRKWLEPTDTSCCNPKDRRH